MKVVVKFKLTHILVFSCLFSQQALAEKFYSEKEIRALPSSVHFMQNGSKYSLIEGVVMEKRPLSSQKNDKGKRPDASTSENKSPILANGDERLKRVIARFGQNVLVIDSKQAMTRVTEKDSPSITAANKTKNSQLYVRNEDSGVIGIVTGEITVEFANSIDYKEVADAHDLALTLVLPKQAMAVFVAPADSRLFARLDRLRKDRRIDSAKLRIINHSPVAH